MSELMQPLRGRVWKFGDSVDTDQLLGAGAGQVVTDNLKAYCLRALRPEFADEVQKGDVLVAGANFGCGSSRQTAVQALQECGIAAVLAVSFARIYRRNSIALALPSFAVPDITRFAADGERLEIDYPARVVRNLTAGGELKLTALPASVEEIYRLGGIFHVIANRLASQGVVPKRV